MDEKEKEGEGEREKVSLCKREYCESNGALGLKYVGNVRKKIHVKDGERLCLQGTGMAAAIPPLCFWAEAPPAKVQLCRQPAS